MFLDEKKLKMTKLHRNIKSFSKLIYKLNIIPIKMPMVLLSFMELNMMFLKVHLEKKVCRKGKKIKKKGNYRRRFS